MLHKRAYAHRDLDFLRRQAVGYGDAVRRFATALLDDPLRLVWQNMPADGARTLPFKRQLYRNRLSKTRGRVNRDMHPVVYFHASLSWLAVSSRSSSVSCPRASWRSGSAAT